MKKIVYILVTLLTISFGFAEEGSPVIINEETKAVMEWWGEDSDTKGSKIDEETLSLMKWWREDTPEDYAVGNQDSIFDSLTKEELEWWSSPATPPNEKIQVGLLEEESIN